MSDRSPELREALGGGWSVLGEYGGGQGRTWRVADVAGREFAFKVLAAGEQAVEVSALSSLRHPAIPIVHQVGRLADGRVFLLRDHVAGEVLDVLPRAPEVLLPILQQLLEVLAYVHLRGICHLDLKPQNLVLDERGGLHLLDFGLSVRGGAHGRGGTPFYAAPELLLGVVPDHRADLFAVGAMIAQAQWGDRQWSLQRFVERFPVDDFFVAAGVARDALPQPFARLVEGCVRRRPERRFPDAEAVIEALCGGSGRPSAALLAPDPVDVFAAEIARAERHRGDVLLRGADAVDRRTVALHLGAIAGAEAIDEGERQVRVVRGGGALLEVELPPLTVERLLPHLERVFGLEGDGAARAAAWLLGEGRSSAAAVADELARLLQLGELLPAGARWSWPAARSGRLENGRGGDPGDRDDRPLVERIRDATASGRIERARSLWLSATLDQELEARTALVEGLLDIGEPARALPLTAGLDVLRAQAMLHTGRFAMAARELAALGEPESARHRQVAAQVAMAGGRHGEVCRLLDRDDASLAERVTLAAALEQAGDLAGSDRQVQRCAEELDAEREPFACATLHTVRGHLARRRGDLTTARAAFLRACELFQRLGHVRHAASEQLNLGVVAKDLGDHQEAVARFREARSLYEHVGDAGRVAIATANLGIAALARDDVESARTTLEQASRELFALGDMTAGRLAAVMLARAHVRAGDAAGAAQALVAVGEADTDRLREEVARVHEGLRSLAAADEDVETMPERSSGGPSRELFRTFLAVNRQLGQAADLDQAMRCLLDAAVTLSGGRNGFLLVMRDDGMRREFGTGESGGQGQAFSRSLAHRAIQEQRTMTGADVLADRELREMPSIKNLQVRSAICAPFRSAGGTAGAVYVEHPGRAGAFSDADKEALEVLADQAAIAVDRMLREESTRHELDRSRRDLAVARRAVRRGPVKLLGDSAVMRELRAQVDKLAGLDLAVLVTGETGTGKELVARALHERGPRASGPFVAENCSALPAELMERELFGHVEGAFTGADRDRPGLLELANGGTLFLDEVGDMPPALQAKLLRALQEQAVRRVGGSESIQLDLRMVAATHKDLRAMVRDGTFREDLFFRLAAVELRVPPLRERAGDVEQLADHFLARHAAERGRALRLSPVVRAALLDHPWPGNVRELEHVIARAALLCDGDEIVDAQLPHVAAVPRPAAPADGQLTGEVGGAVMTLKEAERRAIVAALQACGGDKAKSARALGISRTALYDKLKRLGLDG